MARLRKITTRAPRWVRRVVGVALLTGLAVAMFASAAQARLSAHAADDQRQRIHAIRLRRCGPYALLGADDGWRGQELWRSDGTQAGTSEDCCCDTARNAVCGQHGKSAARDE